MNKTSTFANRLALLRNANNMVQEDLARIISESESRIRKYSILTISAWESGDKCPSLQTFACLCDLFNVSADYLLGRSEIPNDPKIVSSAPTTYEGHERPTYLVTFNELPKFDGEPIYVVFNDHRAADRWGILNYNKKQISFTDSYLTISRDLNCTYYSQIPETQRVPKYNLKKRLSMSQMLAAENVWVEMISFDDYIKGQYNGWYRNNENHGCLINALGLTLPYEGLNISYNCFSSEF